MRIRSLRGPYRGASARVPLASLASSTNRSRAERSRRSAVFIGQPSSLIDIIGKDLTLRYAFVTEVG